MNKTSAKASGRIVAKGAGFERLSGLHGLVPGERIVAKSAGFYRFLTRGPVYISLRTGMIDITGPASDAIEISVGYVDKLTVRRSLFRSRLTVRLGDGTERSIGGLDERDAKRVHDAILVEAVRHASALSRRLMSLDRRMRQLLGTNRYVRHSDVVDFHSVLTPVLVQCRRLVQKYLDRRAREALNRLAQFEILDKLEAERERANALFVTGNISTVQSAAFPDTLSDEQAEAIATDEEVTLVLAGAGAGKTRVIAGKVAHLVRNEAIPSHEILVLAYNREAAKNLRAQLGGDLATTEVKTFHAFGRSVIASAEGRAPTISKLAEDSMALTEAIDGIIQEILQDPRNSRALIDFVANLLTPYRPAYDFDTPAEYKEYVRNAELRTLQGHLGQEFRGVGDRELPDGKRHRVRVREAIRGTDCHTGTWSVSAGLLSPRSGYLH